MVFFKSYRWNFPCVWVLLNVRQVGIVYCALLASHINLDPEDFIHLTIHQIHFVILQHWMLPNCWWIRRECARSTKLKIFMHVFNQSPVPESVTSWHVILVVWKQFYALFSFTSLWIFLFKKLGNLFFYSSRVSAQECFS